MVASLEHASHQRAPAVFFDDVEKVLDELILEHLGGTSLLDDPVGLSASEVQADSCDRQSVVVRKALALLCVDTQMKARRASAHLTEPVLERSDSVAHGPGELPPDRSQPVGHSRTTPVARGLGGSGCVRPSRMSRSRRRNCDPNACDIPCSDTTRTLAFPAFSSTRPIPVSIA